MPDEHPKRGHNYERMQYGQGGRQHSGEEYGGVDLSGYGDHYGEVERYGPEPGYDGRYGRYDQYSRSTPKGYARSDERIRDDVCERLGRSGLDVSDVSVAVAGGRVRLEGSVHERSAKHAIEDCAADCGGVQGVDNRIRVQTEASKANGGRETSAGD